MPAPLPSRFLSLLLTLVMVGKTAVCDEQRELEVLRSHVVAYLADDAPGESTVQRYVTTLGPDGSWPDVDYASQQRGGWLTYAHMARILDLASAYRCAGHGAEASSEVREAVVRALNHWLAHDYRNSNWWYGRIGIPRLAAPALILMNDDLPPETRSKTMELILARSTMGMTGQNEVWVAGIAFMKGLLNEDFAMMQKARDSVLSELRVTTQEGIQADMSFHQHGPQQQWGNYGSSFGHDILKWSMIFRDTRFATHAEQQTLLASYLTEGAPWIVWREQMDVSGCGRQVFPGAQSSKGRSILGQLRELRQLDPTQAETVHRILSSQSPKGENLLVGHKHYWRSDIAVHRRPDWYASVKMSSTRVIGAETCNSENLMGLHLGDGAAFILCSGREYEDLFPLWDWRRLPGTTCRQGQGSLVPSSGRCRGESNCVGGVSDGRHGVATMEYRRDRLSANKSWFFLDDRMICLGAGISCDGKEEVATSIEQSVSHGPVVVSEAGQTRELAAGSWALDSPDWIHHAGIGYRPLQPTEVQVEWGEREGDWRRVNDQDRGTRIARGSVFSLGINHGAAPQRANYAYSIYPATTIEAMPQRCVAPTIRLLQNTESVQAIAVEGAKTMILAVFYAPGRLLVEGDGFVEVDVPCVLILSQMSDEWRLCVADPTHTAEAVHVRTSAARGHDLNIALPQAERAGSTISVQF